MAEKYELDRWAAVVCNGFTAVNVMSSGNVEELGWDYTEMELDPTGTCGLFDGMLLDWDDDTPAERRDHEAYFPPEFFKPAKGKGGKSPAQMAAAARAAAGSSGRPDGGQRPRRAV